MTDQSARRAFYEADGLATEIYDALAASLIAGSPVDGDIDFYLGLAAETGGPVLDVGCGTGRVAAVLAQAGFEVVGVDLSVPMLRLAGRRRERLDAEVAGRLSFTHGDMTTLDLGRDFALIITPSRVFQFALTSDAQRQALAALRRHLRPSGRLVLDLFDPLLDLVVPSEDPPGRGGELVHPTSGNRVTWEVTGRSPDPARQLIVEDWTYREISESGEVLRSVTERLALRWSTRSEMRLLFELSGLEVEAEYGDFRGGPPAYGREQVWVLRRPAGSTMTEDTPTLTPRMKRTMGRAGELARARGHAYLGTEHLILALIDDPLGIAGGVMERLGCADAVRDEVIRIIESDGYSRGSSWLERLGPGGDENRGR